MILTTDRIKNEWSVLLHMDPSALIVPVVLTADAYLQDVGFADARVTDIHRTFAEQMELCRRLGLAPYRSVHEFWRGVDLSVRNVPPAVVGDLVAYLNGLFQYGGRLAVAAFHRTGTAPHIHLQVPPTTRARVWAGAA